MPRQLQSFLGASRELPGSFQGASRESNLQLPKGPCGHDTRNKGLEKLKKSNFQLPKGPCGHDNRNKGLEKVKFPAPKRPLRARQPDKGLEQIKKPKFQLPKDPCGHDIRSKGHEKHFKRGSRQLKMEKCVFTEKWSLDWKNTVKSVLLMKT